MDSRTHWREVCDYDLQFLEELADLIDAHLDTIDEEIAAEADPDAMGVLSRGEYMCGVGLVACQVYLAEVIGNQPLRASLAAGSRHRSGFTFAEIVHAAGNYVKHKPKGLQNPDAVATLTGLGLCPVGRAPSGAPSPPVAGAASAPLPPPLAMACAVA